MTRRSPTGGKASKARGHKTSKPKRGIAPKAARRRISSAVGQETKVARLTRELGEALERQAATTEILEVISSSVGDLAPVFDALLEKAMRLCEAVFGILNTYDGNQFRTAAVRGVPTGFAEFRRSNPPAYGSGTLPARLLAGERFVHILDVKAEAPYRAGDLNRRALVDLGGARTVLGVPLLKEGAMLGMIAVYRQEVRAFSDKQIALLQSFAINETREALERQTATSDILKVIASSPDDVQPVFDAIASSANRLIGGFSTAVHRVIDDIVHLVAFTPTNPESDEALMAAFPRHRCEVPTVALVQKGETAQVADVETADAHTRRLSRARGWRSVTFTPLMNQGEFIGFIACTRRETGVLADHHVQLLRTFADQAVIAIENSRLFNETREALEQQTATADVLKVIAGSPTDLQPVFDAIAERSNRLIGGHATAVYRFLGETVQLTAFTSVNAEADATLKAAFPRPIADIPEFEQVRNGEIVQIPDSEAEGVDSTARDIGRARGFCSVLLAPLPGDKGAIGLISVTRKEPGAFADHHVQLLRTFADQAVIAIQNVRLFDEVQQKTRDLQEALVYQTGSANILKVIASSTTDIAPVLKAIVDSACELCDAVDATVLLRDGDDLRFSMHHGPIPIGLEKWPLNRSWLAGRAFIDKATIHIHDLQSAEGDEFPEGREMARSQGSRTVLCVPLLREHEALGVIGLRRTEVRPFSDKQIALLQTFANQAVIAIENVRLFDEVQARTVDLAESLKHQTATADVLKIISRSTFALQTVLQTLVDSAARLSDADKATITRQRDGVFYRAESYGFSDEFMDYVRTVPVVPDRGSASGRALLEGVVVHIPDVKADPDYTFTEAQKLGDFRTVLSVPMLREGVPVGVIVLTRSEARPFTDKQIELVTTFADQAAIAIENVRLFEEVQAKTRDLSEALTYQTGSGNILRVIASSPTDVEPVLKAIVESACVLCEANDAVVLLKEGDDLRFSAHYGPIAINLEKWPISRNWTAGRAFLDQKPVHLRDMLSDEGADFPDSKELSRHTGSSSIRSILSVPLLRENESIGSILLRRTEVHPFSEKQIALLQTFANQAVIAIGNVHLFEQVQAKTRDLTESLQQQTATSEVLQVISSSPGDLAPVFEKMLENAVRVCGAEFGSMLFLEEDGFVRQAARYNMPLAFVAARGDRAFRPPPQSAMATAIESKQVVHIADVRTTAAYLERVQPTVELAELAGARTIVVVPMLRENEVIGTITVYRQEVRLFDDKQIELLSNFAKQAVIAIENARLLKELRQRTDDLTRSLEDLRTAQDRLVQTEKLASLGQLTAGIAHEIKNPLNFVNNFAALSAELTDELNDVLKPAALADKMREEVDELTGLLKDNLEKVVQHGKRADSIVKNMLLHSREGSGERRFADVNALVEESLNLAYHGARAEKSGFDITLKRDLDPNAGAVELYPQEITRALLNLISNGFYAAIRRKSQAGNETFEPVLSAATKKVGNSIEIRIRDNGLLGIPSEVREKMFNPFFTTKPPGEGTGLGLSMSHDIIVKQHGGKIDVQTEPGLFTEFIVTLPRNAASPT